jgi:opacity protein-like surface antigen
MKKVLAVVAIAGLFASVAYAAPTTVPGSGVRGSIHDMNNLQAAANLGTIAADPQGRVCAFCHTPHHAMTDVNFDYAPLWSHQFTALTPGSGYTGYASATFDTRGGANAFDPLYGPSRLCMSCHDGVVAPDQHYGMAGHAPSGLMASDNFGGKAIGLGGNFSNDHPIGFDVVPLVTATAQADVGIDAAIVGAKTWSGNTNNPTLTVKAGLYDPTGTGATLFMTCATCHDVHNKDNALNTTNWNGDGQNEHQDTVHGNYLVFSPQSGSQLCLTCHLK